MAQVNKDQMEVYHHHLDKEWIKKALYSVAKFLGVAFLSKNLRKVERLDADPGLEGWGEI